MRFLETALRSAAREHDQLLRRPGHRDVAVNGSLDAGAERGRVDEHDEVELQALGELRCQGRDPRPWVEGGIAYYASDSFVVRGEPGLEDSGEIRGRSVYDGKAG